MLLTISHPPPTIVCPPSVNNYCGSSVSYKAMDCIALLLNWVLRGQSFQYVLVYIFTNMHAMSHRSDCFACSCRVNSEELAVCFGVSLLSAVVRVGLPSIQIPTAMSRSISLNISLPEVMICSRNESLFIRDLSNLTKQIIFNSWWASMNVGSTQPIAWDNSRHESSWRFYLHCGNEETGNPGFICIICHELLRHQSEHGTSSMGKHLLAKAHITKLNEFTESEVTESTRLTVDGTALAMLKRQGNRGITIVSSQRKIIFDIQVDPYWPQ